MPAPRYILICLLAAATVASAAPAKKKPAPGSRARQVLLKQALEKKLAGTLVAELNRNKKVWGTMTAEQLRSLRYRYYAYLRQDDVRRARLLEAAAELDRLTDEQRKAYLERADWLAKVVAKLTPAERDQLKKLTPRERAKRLLELKAKLEAADKPPATKPTTTATK